MTTPRHTEDRAEISPWVDKLGGFAARHARAFVSLGNFESWMLRDEIDATSIDRPIYIAGLARSGSTILLEMLARSPDVATHRYRDFPMVLTPRAWNWFIDRAGDDSEEAKERFHGDRIAVTSNSPEAFEEVIWMTFFEDAHDPSSSAVLDGACSNAEFERFYRDHIRKLVALRGGARYLSKGNYNITRLGYLLALFPDARFIVPVRDPVWHVASLIKQHRLFSREGSKDRRVVRHLRRTGHFEFGIDRRPINADDGETVQRIVECWNSGREVEGWAEYWAHVYGHVVDRLEHDAALAKATRIVRYEALCADPAGEMRSVLDHCALAEENMAEHAAEVVSPPRYYQPAFSNSEVHLIRERTAQTATRLARWTN